MKLLETFLRVPFTFLSITSLCVGLGLSSIADAQQSPGRDPVPRAPVLNLPAPGTGSYLSLGTAVDCLGLQTSSYLGVEPAYGHFYVSATVMGGNRDIYQFTASGLLVGAFPQNQNATVTSIWGHRDLTSDGSGKAFTSSAAGGRLWGGQEGGHWVRYLMDAGGALDAGTVLPVVPGIQVIRALARIPGFLPERFVTVDFNGPIREFDEGGNLLNTFSNPGEAFYGLAIDPTDPSRIWGASQTPPATCNGIPGTASMVHVLRMNRASGYTKDLGFEFCGGCGGGIAAGLGIFDGGPAGINSGFYTFSVLQQNPAHRPSIGLYDTAEASGTAVTLFCTSKAALTCGQAQISASGTSSVSSPAHFIVQAKPVRNCRPGLLLYSDQPTQPGIPFAGPGDGLLCLSPAGLRRAGPVESGAGGSPVCSGVLSIDMNVFNQGLWMTHGCNPTASQTSPAPFLGSMGTTVNAQMWGRDSITTGQVLSDGVSWFVGP